MRFSPSLVSLLLQHDPQPRSFVAFKQAVDEFSLVNANVAMVIKSGCVVILRDVGQKW